MSEEIEKVVKSPDNIAKVLISLTITFIVGTIGMIYTNDKNSSVFETKLEYMTKTIVDLNKKITSLESRIQNSSKYSWTREEQFRYEKNIESRMSRLESRILRLEDSKK